MNNTNISKIIDDMQLIMMMPLGRAGSYFFQSLIESHQNIITFPESTKTSFLKTYNIEKFVKNNKFYFNSETNYYFKTDSNVQFNLDHKKYIEIYNEFLQAINFIDEKIDFILKHLSFAKLIGKDIYKIKYIFCHIHDVRENSHINQISNMFPNHHLLLMTRDIRESALSFMQFNTKALNGVEYEQLVYGFFNLTLKNAFAPLLDILKEKEKYKITIVDLNLLHKFQEVAMNNLCLRLSIPFEETILYSTILSNEWSGNSGSDIKLNGFSKSNSILKYRMKLKDEEIALIEHFSSNILQSFNYTCTDDVYKYQYKKIYNFMTLLNYKMYIPFRINVFCINNISVNNKIFNSFPPILKKVILILFNIKNNMFPNLKFFFNRMRIDIKYYKNINEKYKHIKFEREMFLCQN